MDFAATRVAIFGPSAFNKIELNVFVWGRYRLRINPRPKKENGTPGYVLDGVADI